MQHQDFSFDLDGKASKGMSKEDFGFEIDPNVLWLH